MRTTRLFAVLLSIAACACSPSEGTSQNQEALGTASIAVVNGKPLPESVVRIYALATERQNLDEMSPADRERDR